MATGQAIARNSCLGYIQPMIVLRGHQPGIVLAIAGLALCLAAVAGMEAVIALDWLDRPWWLRWDGPDAPY